MADRSERAGRLSGYGLVVLAATCWASGGLTAKWLFTSASADNAGWPLPPLGLAVEPTTLSAGRALSAFIILLAFMALRRPAMLRIARTDLPFLVVFGVIGLAGVHYSYFKAISLTNVATAILLEYLAPVIVLAVSVVFLGHRPTWTLPAGVALSVFGCALVVGAIGGDGLVVSPAGVAWGLASACFFAAYSLMGAHVATRFSPMTVLVYGLGFAALFWLLVLGPSPIVRILSDPPVLLAVLFVAVIGTLVPFTAFLSALARIAPTNATVTSTIEPFLAGLGAFVLFGEALTALQLLGGALVVAAIAVVQLSDTGARATLPPQD
jgi:drug/metabolite transporter (DMT)-like permease